MVHFENNRKKNYAPPPQTTPKKNFAPRPQTESPPSLMGYGHAKNKWIQHVEQTELCYTGKSPTDKAVNFSNWY